MRRTLVSGVLIAIVIAIGVGAAATLIRLRPQAELVTSRHTGYTVEVEEVHRRDYQHRVLGYGTVAPIRTAVLSAEIGGIIVRLDDAHRVGSEVRQDEVLCRIDDASYRQELGRRQSLLEESATDIKRIGQELENARARAVFVAKERDFSRQEVTRQEDLAEAGAGTDQALDQARKQLQTAERFLLELQNQIEVLRLDRERTESIIKAREAEVELARLDFDRCEIRAPIPGVIAERSVNPGELVAAGTSLFRIVDISIVEIPVQIPESEAGEITLDATVMLALPQDPDRKWQGVITRIAPEVDALNRTATIYVQVENRGLDVQLRLGQLVEASIDGMRYLDAVVIPRRALIDGFAFIKQGDLADRREPEVLRALGDDLIIESGIDEGEHLIISNLEVLYDGAKVITSAELNEILSNEDDSPGITEDS